jgi:DNA repair exonuclease SbcCD ATPase subunit
MPYIEYESLEFENAYIYRKCSFPQANQGLVLVRGLNLDDGGFLGAGKSSIFEVFAQLQVGKGGKRDQRRGDHKSDIVNLFSGADMSAILKMRIGGHPYEIRQYRDHHRFQNKVMVIDRQTGQNILPLDASRAPHKWIREELLAIDETTFFNLIYLVQELNNVMVHGKEYERRKRLTVMFNLDIYDELHVLSKRLLSMHETSMSDFAQVRNELREVKQKIFSMPDLIDLEADLEAAELVLQHLQDENAEDTEEFTKVSTLHSKLQQRTSGRRQIMSRFKASYLVNKFDHPKDITQKNVDGWKRQYDNLNAAYASAQAEERQGLLIKLQRLSEPSAPVDDLVEEHEKAKIREAELERSVKNLDVELSNAVCPHCKRPYDLSPEEINSKRTELKQFRDELQELTSRLHALKKEINDGRQIEAIRSRLAMFQTSRSPD